MVAALAAAALLVAVAVLVGRRFAAIYRRDRAWAALADKRQWVDRPFDPGLLHGLPAAARRYFCFALHPGTPIRGIAVIATEQHRAGSRQPARAFAIVAAPNGFLRRGYRAAPLFPVSFTEGLVENHVLAESWLLRFVPWRRGLKPGADAAFERLAIEAVLWTPAALLAPAWRWQAVSEDVARVAIEARGLSATIELTVDTEGRLRAVRGVGKGALAARPATFIEQDGLRLPGLVEMLFAGDSCLGSERIRLMGIRFLEPWMGSSHN